MMVSRFTEPLVLFIPAVSPCLAYSQYTNLNFDVAYMNKCVYEVIVPKPVVDPISYEKLQIRNDWFRAVDGKKPIDRQTSVIDDGTSITAVYNRTENTEPDGGSSTLYSIRYTKSGTVSQEEMESGLNGFSKIVCVRAFIFQFPFNYSLKDR